MLPAISRRVVLHTLPSGTIDLEQGGDGVYLQFNCDCLEALPYCHARCCSIRGITLNSAEVLSGKFDVVTDSNGDSEIRRRADQYCIYNAVGLRTCTVYADRPQTCHYFHCSRGVGMRGWLLSLRRHEDEDD